MIKSLQIENFQSHKSTKILNFHPGVNVIIGLSDSGKSAIIRALRWLIWNRPQGDGFRSHWGGITTSQIETDRGTVIRRKSNKDNDYAVSHYGSKADFITLKAIGTNVPNEIRYSLDINEINLQQQLDRPFLLSDSPGEVAQHFNRIAHIDVIDKSVQSVQRWIREIEQDIRSKDQLLLDSQNEIKKYDYLDEMEGYIVELERMEGQRTHLVQSGKAIEAIVDSINEIEKEIPRYQELLKVEVLVDKVSDVIQIRDTKSKEKNDLSELISNINNTVREIALQEKAVLGMEKEFKKIFPSVCPLCGQEVKK